MTALRPRSLLLMLALGLGLPAAASAQTAAPEISTPVAAELGKLRELTEAKTYAPALALIDRLLAAVPADSYDRALLVQIKAQIFLTEGNYASSIVPLEDALRFADRPGFLTESAHRDALFLLAQLHQQQASESKDPARQRALLAKAADYLTRWQARTSKPTADSQLFAASLHYQQATLDPDRIDAAALAEARRAAEAGLLLQLKPSASFYVLLLAAAQQRADHAQAADLLELLVAQKPANSGYWQQLTSTYLSLAAAAKNERDADRFHLRALLTLERAQALGLLRSPAENQHVVSLYLNLRQFDPAIALLKKGLADGALDNIRRNWELLANASQQARREPQAIEALELAVTRLPAEGQLEFTLAQLLYAAGRVADARARLELAVKKGSLEKPGQTRLFLACTAFELKAYDDADRWARDAAAFTDVKKDDLARLSQAIAEARRVSAASKS